MARLRDVAERVSPFLPPLNFITLHYLYFIATTLITSVIFYCISTPAWSITYTDCLYLQISAMSGAGLNTVNLSEMNTVQQFMLWIQMILGSPIFVSIWVLHVRKKAFEKRFGTVLKAQKEERREQRSRSRDGRRSSQSNAGPGIFDPTNQRREPDDEAIPLSSLNEPDPGMVGRTIKFSEGLSSEKGKGREGEAIIHKRRGSMSISFTGVGASPIGSAPFRRPIANPRPVSGLEVLKAEASKLNKGYRNFLTRDIVGRNSGFHGLTYEEREHLGGVEYRAVTLLSWIVPIYFILWQLIASVSLGAWMAYHASDITEQNGINPWWNGAFNTVSAFNNSGMSLLDQNMIPFQASTYPVITMGFLILAGNTAYPVFLRFILWTMLQILPDKPVYQDTKETFQFVLKHPRRVYTNLFPARPTWWLLMTLIMLNGTDWAFFELLNIGNSALASIPPGSRVLDGLFQALAVRSGGFYIVPITSLRIGVQVLYVVMMYISVYPVAITTRNSNVYEERSLGIYAEDQSSSSQLDSEKADVNQNPLMAKLPFVNRLRKGFADTHAVPQSETRSYFVRQQIRGQLAHDLYWLVVAIFIIVCVEVAQFDNDPVTFSVFNVIFEVVSGYGCVGISTGVPWDAYSFSGAWHIVSKLILCAIMLRGRHRGLPVALDKAILLPAEGMGWREEEDHELRRGRTWDVGASSGLSRSMTEEMHNRKSESRDQTARECGPEDGTRSHTDGV